MITDRKVARRKLSFLDMAYELANTSNACKIGRTPGKVFLGGLLMPSKLAAK